MLEPLDFKVIAQFGDPEESLQLDILDEGDQEVAIPALVDTSAIDPLNVAFILESSMQGNQENLTSKFKLLQTNSGINITDMLDKEAYFDGLRGASSYPISKRQNSREQE